MAGTTFGDYLRFFRMRASLTQHELAQRTGVSVRAIRDMERGRARHPQRRTLDLLAGGLDLVAAETAVLADKARRGTDAPPPPRAAAAESLPPAVPDLTGRATEVAALTRIAEECLRGSVPRVVVVHGPPGVGKTSLAVRVARDLAGRFPDGSVFADLRGMDARPPDVSTVASRLLAALGHEPGAVPPDEAGRLSLYRSTLRERSVLVLLDNPAAEVQVRPLLTGSPGSMLLVTSRNTLAGLEAADRLEVPLLAEDDALDLLRAIAGAERVAAEPEAARRVVALCGGVPLAVRIAGNRVAGRRWPLARMAGDLADADNRLSALSAGDERVRAAFDMSYRHLDPDAAEVFRRLSLMPGQDVAADLAAVLADRPVDVTEALLEDLVDNSLVAVAADPGRYAFHDLLRLYSRESLHAHDGPDTADRVGDAAADWLLPTAVSAARWFDPGHAPEPDDRFADWDEASAWLGRETGNWVGALRTAARRGRHRLVLDTANAMHWYSDGRGSGELWHEVFSLGVEAATALGSPREEAVQANFLCWTLLILLARPDEALVMHERALRAAEASGDLVEQAWAHYYRADIDRFTNDIATAVDRVDKAVALFREAGHRTGELVTRAYGTQLLLRVGQVDEAAAVLAREADGRRATVVPGGTDQRNFALTLIRLAGAYSAGSRWREALDALDEAETHLTEDTVTAAHTDLYTDRGTVLLALGDHAGASRWLHAALEHPFAPLREVGIRLKLAELGDAVGDPDSSREHLVRALSIADRHHHPDMRALAREAATRLGLPADR
ncbi:ATP-binding protein [Actinokineospora sp. 24-640]